MGSSFAILLQIMHHGKDVTERFDRNVKHQQCHVNEQCTEQWKNFRYSLSVGQK
jgi:uncharacterized alpha/beta hydrolase family protein